jgi:hypothetical protein
VRLWKRHLAYLDAFLAKPAYRAECQALNLDARRQTAAAELDRAKAPAYLDELVGTLGTDPSVAGVER